MKIAVGGKGGSGKTTVAGTLARVLAERGQRVVALDDDSNPNLAITLGLPHGEAASLPAIPRDWLEEKPDGEGGTRLELKVPAEEFIDRFGQPAGQNLTLLVMGQPSHGGSGCLCRAHAPVRGVLRGLVSTTSRMTVVDLEAGLEHLSRGTARHVDTLLLIAEPYFKSLEAAQRSAGLAKDLGIGRTQMVANKIRSSRDEDTVREFAGRHAVT